MSDVVVNVDPMAQTVFERRGADVSTPPPSRLDADQPRLDADQPRLDTDQRRVVELADDASAAVIGAPGSGKTATLVELVAERVRRPGWSPEHVLVLASSRATATALRDRLAVRVAAPTDGPLARSAASLAFEIASASAVAGGHEPPRLITGGEQDADIAQLLAGHVDEGTGPAWPAPLDARVRALRGFRTELRELYSRVIDRDVPFDDLRRLAEERGHPEWRAAADFFDDYTRVGLFTRPGQFDSSELVRLAVTAIDAGDLSDRVSGIRLIVVDDFPEVTESSLALLRAFARRGVAVVAFGDPDVAANAFRGGEPDALGRFATVLGLPAARTIHLGAVHRGRVELRDLVVAVTSRVGAAAAGPQRAARMAADADPAHGLPSESVPPALARIEATTPARQWAAVARELRERHLLSGVPWTDLCVVVRSNAQVPEAARALTLAEVPTRIAVGGRPVREDRAARALLTMVDVGMSRSPLTSEIATELLLGPFGGLDRLGLRRLRLALRAEEVAGGGIRSADELVVEALAAPGRLVTIDHRVARTAGRMADTLAAVEVLAGRSGSIEELLWLAWERSGRGPAWRELALSSGILATEANRDLDGIVALFTAAKRFAERRPDAPAGLFLDEVLDAEVPEDTLSPQSHGDAVLVATPSGTVGLEFDTVVVAGLQDGVWPNRRPRGSLLAPDEFVRAVSGIDSSSIDERRLVLDDELRMFALAVSRASTRVVLAAVANDDEARSVFFSLLPPDAPLLDSATAVPLSLRATTGRLRRRLTDPRADPATRDAAAATLARLAQEDVPGADTRDWHGLVPASSTGPLFDGVPVPISPSRLERFEESPLDWFVETVGGSSPTVSMNVGTLVHWAMETAGATTVESLWRAVETRWTELAFDSPWLAEHQRRAARALVGALAEYLADFEGCGHALVAAENRFRLEVGDAVVSGSIDRVERTADGRVVIVDLKTGSPKTRQAEIDEHPQLAAYQLAYSSGAIDALLADSGDHVAGGAKLLWVKKGVGGKAYRESHQAPFDDERVAGFRARVADAAARMSAAEFEGVVELDAWGLGTQQRLALHRVRAVSSD